jgi:hypothetical protein
MSMEAAAAGTKVISYAGNPYADFWLSSYDHRQIAKDMIAIGKGEVAPRADKLPVPTEQDMAEAMVNVYERVLDRPKTLWAMGQTLPDALDPMIRDALLSARGQTYTPPKEHDAPPEVQLEVARTLGLVP